MMKKLLLFITCFCISVWCAVAANVTITMNSVSPKITLAKANGDLINVGTMTNSPASYSYTFDAEPGEYALSVFTAADLSNGTISLTITNEPSQVYSFTTVTAGATNSGWALGIDYTLEYRAVGKEGAVRNVSAGFSATANRIAFPMRVGDSYFINIVPNAAHTALVDGEKYMKTGLFGTVTASSATAQGAAMQGSVFSFTVPEGASLFVGEKMGAVTQGTGGIHYVPFPEKEPIGQTTEFGKTTYQFLLGTGSSINYNYRVSQSGKITNAGKFTRSSTLNSIEITADMLNAYPPNQIDHNPASNSGANVGDILMNINAQGHLRLTQGNVRSILALRSWQLTDDCCNNYFIEPDFHFTVLNENGQPDNRVITVDNKGLITAVGTGTAIVQVTYDAVFLRSHKNGGTSPFYFGSFWGAIWPENTGTFVVSVGDNNDTSIKPNMYIREDLSTGGNVDAEFDVFYYTEDLDGYSYAFKPEGVTSVSIANPIIGTHSATYTGFTPIAANADGSYTLLLTFGSNIVKLTSESGISKYQVLRAKPCGYTITNNTRPGQSILPGEEAYIQFHGFFHPANKLAGIYNQAAAVLYNDTPNSTTIVGGANQYQFGGTPSAQLVKVTIPSNWDPKDDYVLKNGAIQVNGFGSVQGKHRSISTVSGVAPNFTAEVHVGYFGSIPNVAIPVEASTDGVYFTNLIDGATIKVKTSAKETITANSEGQYIARPRTNYTYEISLKGYQTATGTFDISAGQGIVAIPVSMPAIASEVNGWDGTHIECPAQVTAEESNTTGGVFEGMEGYYKITNGYELAWLSYQTLQGNNTLNAVLVNDVDLGNSAWTPIGASATANRYSGVFDGGKHTIKQLYINSTADYQGLFGYINGATVRNLTVEGSVSVSGTGGYVAGIVAYSSGSSVISNCHNKATVTGYRFVGGILGYSPNAALQILDCSNSGGITSSDTYAGGIVGCLATSPSATINRVFNSGSITAATNNAGGIAGRSDSAPIINAGNTGTVTTAGTVVAGISASLTSAGSITNAYNGGNTKNNAIASLSTGTVTNVYTLGANYTDATVKTATEFASGEVAWLLGAAFGQTIGTDALPVLNGAAVYQVNYTNNQDTETSTIYTNGELPVIVKNGYTGTWYTNSDGTVISEISGNATLYVVFTDTEAPGIPIDLAGTPTETSVALIWTEPNDNAGVTGYNVYSGEILQGTTTGTSYTVASLSPATQYTFKVEAFDAAGNKSGTVSTTVTTTDVTAPTPPLNLVATPSETSISLLWEASIDNVGVNGYNVYLGEELLGTTTNTSFSVTGLSPASQYTFGVEAFDAAGNKSGTASVIVTTTDITAPTPPLDLVAAPSETSISLLWKASTDNVGVNGYNVYLGKELLGTTTNTSFSAVRLLPLTPYSFSVEAFDAAGNKSGTASVSAATTDETAPTAPSFSEWQTGDTSVEIQWRASTDNVGVTGYQVYVNGNPYSTTNYTGITITGLNVATQYLFKVIAFDAAGNKSQHSLILLTTTDKTAPTAPTNLKAYPTETSATLTWAASTDNAGVAGYNVYIGDILVGTTSDTNFNMTNLATASQYAVSVEAFDAAGNKSGKTSIVLSTVDHTAPTAPLGLIANPDETTIALSWNASSDNVGVDGYNIYKQEILVGTTSNTTFSVKNLDAANLYSFMVEAFDKAGNKSDKSTITVSTLDKTAPSTPNNLAGIPYETSVLLSWETSSDNSKDVAYNVYRGESLVGTTTNTSFNVSDLSIVTQYSFNVEAVDKTGNKSGKATVLLSTVDRTSPTIPTDVKSQTAEASIMISWTASTDNVGVTGYNIYQDEIKIGTSTNTNFIATNLTTSTQYTFKIEAFDAAGNISEKASITQSTWITGISPISKTAINIYPNPFADYIIVETPEDGSISIIDISGRTILIERIEMGKNHIDTSNLLKGAYFLKCGKNTVKIIK